MHCRREPGFAIVAERCARIFSPCDGRWCAVCSATRTHIGAQDEQGSSTIVIAGAARTPVGSFNGALASLPAHELGKFAIKAALERAHVESGDVSEVIMGQILAAGAGSEPGAAGLHRRRHSASTRRPGA